jgi:hypothetical protein
VEAFRRLSNDLQPLVSIAILEKDVGPLIPLAVTW